MSTAATQNASRPNDRVFEDRMQTEPSYSPVKSPASTDGRRPKRQMTPRVITLHNDESDSRIELKRDASNSDDGSRLKRRRTRRSYLETDQSDTSDDEQVISDRETSISPEDSMPVTESPQPTSLKGTPERDVNYQEMESSDFFGDNEHSQENIADEVEENDDDEIKQAKLFVKQAKQEARELKTCVENVLKRYYDMKIQEIQQEIELVEKGTHQDYIKQMSQLEVNKDRKVKRALEKYKHSVESAEDTFDAAVTLANDSYIDAQRRLRNRLLLDKSRLRWRLKQEFDAGNQAKTMPGPYFTAVKYANKKRLTLEMAANSVNGLVDSTGIPGWTRRMIKKRKRAGMPPVVVPLGCVGLTESEKDDDLSFLELLTSK